MKCADHLSKIQQATGNLPDPIYSISKSTPNQIDASERNVDNNQESTVIFTSEDGVQSVIKIVSGNQSYEATYDQLVNNAVLLASTDDFNFGSTE